MSCQYKGPKFNLDSDRLFIVLGHSERVKTGEAFAQALDDKKIFKEIDIISLNKVAAFMGRKTLKHEMSRRLVVGHSAAVTRVRSANQIIAINPPEPVGFIDLLKRANEIMSDPIEKEPNAHKSGILDMIGAGLELIRSPAATVNTMRLISGGYSAVDDLALGASRFPAGRAIVHSEKDGFGFSELADLDKASRNGVTTLVLPSHYHNELLLAPARTIELMTPALFPQS